MSADITASSGRTSGPSPATKAGNNIGPSAAPVLIPGAPSGLLRIHRISSHHMSPSQKMIRAVSRPLVA